MVILLLALQLKLRNAEADTKMDGDRLRVMRETVEKIRKEKEEWRFAFVEKESALQASEEYRHGQVNECC